MLWDYSSCDEHPFYYCELRTPDNLAEIRWADNSWQWSVKDNLGNIKKIGRDYESSYAVENAEEWLIYWRNSMKIRIIGKSKLIELMNAEPKQHDVLHYTNADMGPVQEVKDNAKDWFHIAADDIDHYSYRMHFPPTAKNIADALKWSEGKKDLIVACHAGISRSSATAYLIAARELGPEWALDILEKGYHWPNRLIVYIGSKLLKNDKVWDKFVEWQKTHNHMDPSQNNTWPHQEVKSQIYWP